MSNPVVSVVMAVYNGERYLKPSIESTLNQTFNNFEFVIVNDASTDRTKEIIHSYNDSRIKLYNNEKNIGQTKSLNVGLNIAKGKYIARIDAGDVSMPKRLKKQLTFMEKNKEITVLGTSAFRYDESGRIIDVVHMPTSPSIILQRIFYASPLVHISAMMNREAILHLGGYDEDYYVLADYDLWSRLLRKNFKLSNLREVLVGYMVSSESFGAIHSMQKSIVEASKIIQTNIKTFTNLSISFKEATNLYKLLALNMSEMSIHEILESEVLYKNIFNDIGTHENDINYYLTLRYLKYVIQNLKRQDDRLKWQHALSRILSNGLKSIFCRKFYDEILFRFIQSFFWRLTTNFSDFQLSH